MEGVGLTHIYDVKSYFSFGISVCDLVVKSLVIAIAVDILWDQKIISYCILLKGLTIKLNEIHLISKTQISTLKPAFKHQCPIKIAL